MAEINYLNNLNTFEHRQIRYTQFITSMLATIDGKTYTSVHHSIMPNGGGVSETFPHFGNGMENNSLQKRWKQARSLTTAPGTTGLSQGHPQANIDYIDTQTEGQDPNDSIVHSKIDATDTTSTGKFVNGPYKMSDFFGFSHVDITNTYNYQTNQTNYFVPHVVEEDIPTSNGIKMVGYTKGFSKGMQIIKNTDDGHPDLATWYDPTGNSNGDYFPLGAFDDPIIYAGGDDPLTDYNSLPGAPSDGFSYNNNPSANTLQLHLGPGIDSWYGPPKKGNWASYPIVS